MNPKDAIKISSAVQKFRIIDQKVRVLEKVNTSLPKHKARHFDKLLKPLYAERNRLKYNANSLIQKAQKKAQ